MSGNFDPAGAISRNVKPSTPAPALGAGLPSGTFFLPSSDYHIAQRQPYYRVQIWRVNDGPYGKGGGEWRVMDINQHWHEVGEFVTSISTSHNIGDPAGQFSIGLLPIRLRISDKGPTRTWGELLKPMDYVEISLARSRKYVGHDEDEIRKALVAGDIDPPHVVMRGFISNVRVVDSVDGQSGQPRRRVMVNGMNFGKLWTIYRMYLLDENTETFRAKYMKFFTAGANALFLTPAEFMGAVYGGIFKPQLALLAKTLPQVLRHTVYCDVPSDGRYKLNPAMMAAINTFQGPLDSLVRQYVSKPYMELFTYDEPWPQGKPITIWRWAPLLNRANRFPMPDHIYTKPAVRELHAYEIQEHDIGTSDSDAITYYWPNISQSQATTMKNAKLFVPGYLDEAKLRIYGFRPFEPEFHWMADRVVEKQEVATSPVKWAGPTAALRDWLASCYEHVIDNMEGQIVANGRPDIHVGEYLDVPEAGYRYYVEGVNHSLVVGQGFTTSITVTRGLPQGDMPKWVLPAGYQFQKGNGASGEPTLGGPDPKGGYVAPHSDGKEQPKQPQTSGGSSSGNKN